MAGRQTPFRTALNLDAHVKGSDNQRNEFLLSGNFLLSFQGCDTGRSEASVPGNLSQNEGS